MAAKKKTAKKSKPKPKTKPKKTAKKAGKKVYVIDGKNFSTLEEFYIEISDVLIPGAEWGHNLDAFNDILRGGFGTPDKGFVLKWKNFSFSEKRFGYKETVKELQKKLKNCHPSWREELKFALEDAQNGQGQTILNWIHEIICRHTRGGVESRSGIEFIVEG